MRIKSSFKDYYDRMQSYVYGPSIVWNREWSTGPSLNYVKKCKYGSHQIVGFCGKIYGYIKTAYQSKIDGKKKIFYKYHNSADNYFKYNPYHNGKSEIRRYLEDFLFVKEDNKPFINNNCLVFYEHFTWRNEATIYLRVSSSNRICGPTLQDIEFDKILSMEDAYTQLTSYLDFLGTQYKCIPEMSDELKLQQHGFDKYSFKK